MNTLHKLIAAAVLATVAGVSVAQPAASATVTAQLVRIVVPDLAGEHIDDVARMVTARLDSPSRKFVIENRPGDYYHFGAEIVSRSRPDGNTLLFAPVTQYAAAISQFANLYYDLQSDFTAVALVANAPHALVVHPSLRVKSVSELIAIAKARPGEVKWGTHGTTSLSRLEMEMFRNLSGISVDTTPSNSGRMGLRDLLGGNTAVVFDSLLNVLPLVNSNRAHVIAIAGSRRSPALPQLPTIAEAGVAGFEADYWYGILAPEGVDPAIIKSLHGEFARALASDSVKKSLLSFGIETRGDGPADFAKILRADLARWAQVAKRAGIAPR